MGTIRTVKDIVVKHFGLNKKRARPTARMVADACDAAEDRGVLIADDGRCYAPFVPSPPRGKRWKNGKLIPRRA